jgi:hypothetical protein
MRPTRRELLAGAGASLLLPGAADAALVGAKRAALLQGVSAWWDADALIDADIANSRYRYNGASYSQSGFLTAIGGSEAAGAWTIGPTVVGSELIAGDFSGGIGSFAESPSYAASGGLSVVDGELRADMTGTTTQYRWSCPFTTVAGRAYVLSATAKARSTSPALLTATLKGAGNSADLFSSADKAFTLGSLPQTLTLVAGAQVTTSYIGMAITGGSSQTPWLTSDDYSVREVYPYSGWSPGAMSFELSGVMPAAAAGNKVLAQWGEDAERERVRLVWDASSHLRLITTAGGTERSNLDMGVVSESAAFSVEGSIAADRVAVRLAGAASLSDTSALFPGIGKFWIGRSFTGETFDGTISRLTVWARERAPMDLTWIEGDSYGAGGGSANTGLVTALPAANGRALFSTAVGSTTLAQQVARVQALPGLTRAIFVHWDGDANSYTDVATTMANYAALVAAVGHTRYIIVTPCRRANANSAQNIAVAEIQTQLKALYGDHIVDAQAILAALATSPGDDADVASGYIPDSLLQVDDTHLTATGMNACAAEIAALITSNGW